MNGSRLGDREALPVFANQSDRVLVGFLVSIGFAFAAAARTSARTGGHGGGEEGVADEALVEGGVGWSRPKGQRRCCSS